MGRAKELLALAPFVALAIAISYLQGYWGTFEILAFPYLSFQELLAYSAAPMFGFVFIALVGMLFGTVNQIADRGQQKSKWIVRMEDLIVISLCAVLIYFDRPEKWLFTPLVILGLVTPPILRLPVVLSVREANPHMVLSISIMIFLLLGSFGYGRTQAERLIRDKEPNAQITLDSGTETGKLLGRLDTNYFFLNSLSRVVVLPERSIKRIEYRKEYKSGV